MHAVYSYSNDLSLKDKATFKPEFKGFRVMKLFFNQVVGFREGFNPCRSFISCTNPVD